MSHFKVYFCHQQWVWYHQQISKAKLSAMTMTQLFPSYSLSSSWQPPGKDTGPSISLPLARVPGISVKNIWDIVAADKSDDNAGDIVRIERWEKHRFTSICSFWMDVKTWRSSKARYIINGFSGFFSNCCLCIETIDRFCWHYDDEENLPSG